MQQQWIRHDDNSLLIESLPTNRRDPMKGRSCPQSLRPLAERPPGAQTHEGSLDASTGEGERGQVYGDEWTRSLAAPASSMAS